MLRGGERSSSRGRSGPGPRLAGDQIRRRRRAPLPRPRPRRRAIVVVDRGPAVGAEGRRGAERGGGRATPRVARARCRQMRAPRRERPRGHRVGGPGGATRAHARPVPPRCPADPRGVASILRSGERRRGRGAVPPRGRTPRQVGHRVAPRRGRRARLPDVRPRRRRRRRRAEPETGRPVRIYSGDAIRRGRIRRRRRPSSGGGGSRGRVVDRHRARGRSERAGGRQRFSQRGVHARRRTQRGRQRVQHPGDGELAGARRGGWERRRAGDLHAPIAPPSGRAGGRVGERTPPAPAGAAAGRRGERRGRE